jgi:hypothetical protein
MKLGRAAIAIVAWSSPRFMGIGSTALRDVTKHARIRRFTSESIGAF